MIFVQILEPYFLCSDDKKSGNFRLSSGEKSILPGSKQINSSFFGGPYFRIKFSTNFSRHSAGVAAGSVVLNRICWTVGELKLM